MDQKYKLSLCFLVGLTGLAWILNGSNNIWSLGRPDWTFMADSESVWRDASELLAEQQGG